MKTCFKCNQEKPIDDFYVHKQMGDGHLGKCKECTKQDAKIKRVPRKCEECGRDFKTMITEIKRGGGITCSRDCYYLRLKKIVRKGEQSPNWKGDNVGTNALHEWVKKNLGRPMKCEHCNTTTAKKFEWANKSQEYKRELSDWLRLCTKCHAKYDYSTRLPKWRATMSAKFGWNVSEVAI